jgi:hypothetical protein
MACSGRCHAPIKSRRTSPTGDERHNKGSQAHRPTASKRVRSPPVGTLSTASDVTDTRKSKQQASSGSAATSGEPARSAALLFRRKSGGPVLGLAVEALLRASRSLAGLWSRGWLPGSSVGWPFARGTAAHSRPSGGFGRFNLADPLNEALIAIVARIFADVSFIEGALSLQLRAGFGETKPISCQRKMTRKPVGQPRQHPRPPEAADRP